MYDSDYNGRADDGDNPILCKCNCVAVKHVAFEGCWTGRRFLACAGEVCSTEFRLNAIFFDSVLTKCSLLCHLCFRKEKHVTLSTGWIMSGLNPFAKA